MKSPKAIALQKIKPKLYFGNYIKLNDAIRIIDIATQEQINQTFTQVCIKIFECSECCNPPTECQSCSVEKLRKKIIKLRNVWINK
jgi:hypothetical protein